ncbi:hypothetical protein EZV62_003331 [Acer yangbiense]|uniref:Uncharacterized protein n=1 Tax=Acer yangbiense TaxID=1000413 RepID=A0A5C7IIQ1_9ROSI|nr:hypothetical protein EZV62_003331 [Acer yangbiense]
MIGGSGSWNYEKAIDFLKEPAFAAVRLGIYEVVNEVLKAYIGLVSFTDELGYHMLSWAIVVSKVLCYFNVCPEEVQIELMKKKIIERNVDVARYLPLYRAIREKKWKRVEDFVANNPEALHDDITETGENIFHFLGQFNEAIGLVNKFLIKVPPESLERTNIEGITALTIAALSGNTEAAKAFVNKNIKLLSIKHKEAAFVEKRKINVLSKEDMEMLVRNKNNPPSRKDMEEFAKKKSERQGDCTFLPVHAAAYCSRKETVEYLISETAKVEDLTQDSGLLLLKILIRSNLFGTALDLLERYPVLAIPDRNYYWERIFERLARTPKIYASGSIPLQEEKKPYPLPKRVGGDIEKQTERFQSCLAESKPLRFLQATFGKLSHELNIMLWKRIMRLAPSIRHIHDQKLMHTQTLEIVKKMIGGYSKWNYEKAIDFLKEPAFIAVSLGIYEVVNEILKAYIGLVSFTDELGYHMLSLAVKHRQEKVFKLVYEVCHPMIRDKLTMGKNIPGDTILHIAAVLAPPSKIPCAALQMQSDNIL